MGPVSPIDANRSKSSRTCGKLWKNKARKLAANRVRKFCIWRRKLVQGFQCRLCRCTVIYPVDQPYRTVNAARSMLSSTLPVKSVNGGGIGKDPLVSSLLRGVYNICHPIPMYTASWSPDTVLSYFDATANTNRSVQIVSQDRNTRSPVWPTLHLRDKPYYSLLYPISDFVLELRSLSAS